MKITVVYCSKHGSVRRYAEFIGEKLGGAVVDLRKYSPKKYPADTTVFGGRLVANRIKGLEKFRKKFKKAEGDAVYYCCGYTPESKSFSEYLAERNAVAPLFYMRGKTDLKSIKGAEESVIKGVMRELTMQDPSSLTDEEKSILAAVTKSLDYVDARKTDAIVSYINSKTKP